MQQDADPGEQVAAQYGLHRSPKWQAAELLMDTMYPPVAMETQGRNTSA
jgi:hypothetical protein